MSIYGIATQNSTGTVLYMYSPEMNGVFYNTNGVYTNTANLPITGFSTQYAVATPTSPSSYSFGNNFNTRDVINVAGSISADGTSFLSPSAIETGGNCFQLAPTINPISTQVYTFGTPQASTGYGFSASGSSPTNFSVDATHKAYYLQPSSSGSFLRSGTCTSLPSSFGTSIASYTQPTGGLSQPNITFEKSFVNPPLIFITSSSGPIALNYMTQDSSGKYNGASIVAGSSFSNQGVAGTAPYTANTYSFEYFLVSDEEPIYGAVSNYGLKVWSGLPNNEKVFDSSYFCPTFQSFIVEKPYMWLVGSYTNASGCAFTGAVNYFANQANFTKTGSNGVLLNNLNAIAGYTRYTSLVLGSGSTASGPTTFYGRFVTVTSTTVTITGTGACGIFSNPTYNAPGWGYSYDFSRGASLTMSVVFANYVY
jgi:hypothetical protein